MKMRNAIAAAAAACLALAMPTYAQDKIDKPVKILVGFAPGGTADIIARVVAEKMGASLGQTVVVENKPGAIGRIAAEAVKARHPTAPRSW
jgi:tripartite-type tricarboxylate transporter receptor subunit TctC